MIECDTKCNSCGCVFRLSTGGTMLAYELRCTVCGKAILVMRKRRSSPGDDEIAYAEKTARKCSCGGEFKYDAPARCPKCRSIDIGTIENGNVLFSD
jgi:hypothetical protein